MRKISVLLSVCVFMLAVNGIVAKGPPNKVVIVKGPQVTAAIEVIDEAQVQKFDLIFLSSGNYGVPKNIQGQLLASENYFDVEYWYKSGDSDFVKPFFVRFYPIEQNWVYHVTAPFASGDDSLNWRRMSEYTTETIQVYFSKIGIVTQPAPAIPITKTPSDVFEKLVIHGGGLVEPIIVKDAKLLSFTSFTDFLSANRAQLHQEPSSTHKSYLIERFSGVQTKAFDRLRYYPAEFGKGGFIFYEGVVDGWGEYDTAWYVVRDQADAHFRDIVMLKSLMPKTGADLTMVQCDACGYSVP